jgi:hypothetical protein
MKLSAACVSYTRPGVACANIYIYAMHVQVAQLIYSEFADERHTKMSVACVSYSRISVPSALKSH